MSNRFSKIDTAGRAMPADATEWAAVYDATSGLMWSRANLANGEGEHEMNHADAEKACAALASAESVDWRLPTVEELFPLADRSKANPAIDADFFPTCKSDWYWTSTPAAWSSSNAWIVAFANGSAFNYHRSYGAFVRAVRSVTATSATRFPS